MILEPRLAKLIAVRPRCKTAEATRHMENEPWILFCQEVDELLQTGQYAWAEDVLRRMRRLAETRHNVTDGQRLAVQNLRATKERWAALSSARS